MDGARQLAEIIYGAVIGVIAISGLLFGGWQLYEGWTGDQPESKRKGFTILIVVAVVIGLLLKAKGIVFGMAGL